MASWILGLKALIEDWIVEAEVGKSVVGWIEEVIYGIKVVCVVVGVYVD